LALDFTENCQDLLGTKKSNILPNIYEEIFFKLAHYFFSFCECNPISDIHLKHTDHCFQFFSNKIWSITNITRMPHLKKICNFEGFKICKVVKIFKNCQKYWIYDANTWGMNVFIGYMLPTFGENM